MNNTQSKVWFSWGLWAIIITIAFVVSNFFNKKPSQVIEVVEPKDSIEVNTDKTPLDLKNHSENVNTSVLTIKADFDTLLLLGEVKDDNSLLLAQKIIELNDEDTNDPINLIIDSPGGSVFSGAKIIAAIESTRRPVHTICYGMCASMAAMIHQYGTKRYMTKGSVLMFHNASGGVSGEVPKMISRLNMVNLFVKKMDAYVANKSGIDSDTFRTLVKDEIWIDTDDALKLKLHDRIVSVNLKDINPSGVLQLKEHLKTKSSLRTKFKPYEVESIKD